ncbi:MAG: bifunctional YncE family protein/alkaline phosphatase family protein [Bacteroidetes bacterium]|nr:bifunctional YncE family protein/alkaline phosphatase family protein [Bacteroidota bacterium]
MRKFFYLVFILSSLFSYSQTSQQKEMIKSRITLPNGWSLTPVGRSLPLGDLPLSIAVSRSQKYIAITNNGQSTQSLILIDPKKEVRLDSITIPKSWLGLKFSSDEKFLYASGGNDNWILKYAIIQNKLVLKDSIILGKKWPEKISPAGFDIDDAKHIMYVVTKENNSLYIINLLTKSIIKKIGIGSEGYTCLLSNDKKILFVTCWGCDKLLLFDTEHQHFLEEIAVGDNPNDICSSKNGKYLFVANANDNSVSVVDLQKRNVIETLNAALFPDAPEGSTTNALALSEDDKRLYVANADNNCVAVFDVSIPGKSKSKGFIPVGWYPTAVKVIGKKVFVANGKGFSSLANPFGPNPVQKKQQVNYQGGDKAKPKEVQYIGGLFKGTLSIFNEPGEADLAKYSALVYENTPYTKTKEMQAQGEAGNPIPMKVGDTSLIKYVFYIIKENRTYDQVLGDIKEGNGDASLVLFGERVTPNLHALAKEFVLLDNFYCDAEVSADGHNWSMGAYADDYLEKTWPTSYGGRGGSYDGEGNREIANNKSGFIWDDCRRSKVSYRTYGEFADESKPNIAVLKNHVCTSYTGWDLGVMDTVRFQQWKKDFDSLLAANALPHFNTVRFGNDHTEGLRKGRPTPFAHVADNDLAVGEFVEYLSKSPVWKESVVFILEDDAQNGADHVDAHRSTAYIAGGYVKRHYVDHTMYSTTSMVHTIELILGMPPMSQYDAAATPMWRCFSATPDLQTFTSLPANIDLTEKNIAWNELARKSAQFDFTKEDKVPEDQFNEVLWKGIKGMNYIVPAPKRAAFVKVTADKDDN